MKTSFSRFCIASSLALAPLQAEEFRTFTNLEGKSIKAAVTAIEGANVTLKLESGRTVQAAPTLFSAEDQAYFQTWAKANPSTSDYRFQVKVTPVRKSRSNREEGIVKVTYEEWAYKVELTSIGRTALSDVTVEYRVYKELGDVEANGTYEKNSELKTSGKHGYREGQFAIANMARLATSEFETASLPVMKSDLKAGWDYIGKDKEKNKDDLAGIWLRVVHGGKPVFEHKTIKAPVTW